MVEQSVLTGSGWTGLLQIVRTALEILVALAVLLGCYISYKKFTKNKNKNEGEGS